MTFSNRLSALMKQYDFRQAYLAELLGVSQQTVSRWVQGKFQPDIDQLIALAGIFHVSIDYLVGLSDFPVQFFDTKKDPSPADQERAMDIALNVHANLPADSQMPQDLQSLISLVQRIVDLELDKRSTPSGNPT